MGEMVRGMIGRGICGRGLKLATGDVEVLLERGMLGRTLPVTPRRSVLNRRSPATEMVPMIKMRMTHTITATKIGTILVSVF